MTDAAVGMHSYVAIHVISENFSVDSFNVLIGFSQNEISQVTVSHLVVLPRMKPNKLAGNLVSLKQPITSTNALLSMLVGYHLLMCRVLAVPSN